MISILMRDLPKADLQHLCTNQVPFKEYSSDVTIVGVGSWTYDDKNRSRVP